MVPRSLSIVLLASVSDLFLSLPSVVASSTAFADTCPDCLDEDDVPDDPDEVEAARVTVT